MHAAAWTDVDGCAREPDLAQRRNGDATGVLAAACAARGVDLLIVSTNEVFAGRSRRPRGYAPTDPTAPPNAYGRSKLAGEQAATEAFEAAGRDRQSRDRPDRLAVRAAGATTSRTRSSTPLRRRGPTGSRCASLATSGARPRTPPTWPMRSSSCSAPTRSPVSTTSSTARSPRERRGREDVLDRLGVRATVEHVPATTWERASVPPRWGVLAATPLPGGEPMRSWRAAMADYAPVLRRDRERTAATAPQRRRRGVDRPRPPRLDARRASATGRSPDSKTRAGPSARSGATTRSARSIPADAGAPPGSRGTLRPGQPLDLGARACFAACTSTSASSTTGSSPRAAHSSRSSTCARCSRGESDRPLVETRELTADEWVDIPIGVAHGFLALEPLAAHLPRDERVRRQRRAGVRLGRSRWPRCRGPPSTRRPTAARSSRTATARTRR